MEKQIHGESIPLWKQYKLKENPPIPCDFKLGDIVIFTNDYGVKFTNEIIGFSQDDSFYGRFIHLAKPGTKGEDTPWWMPEHPSSLKKYA